MNCPSCGAEARPGTRFCTECGTDLGRPAEKEPPTEAGSAGIAGTRTAPVGARTAPAETPALLLERRARRAAILSALLPGLGQISIGRAVPGALAVLVSLAGAGAMIFLFIEFVSSGWDRIPETLLPLLVLLFVFGLYTAHSTRDAMKRVAAGEIPDDPVERGCGVVLGILIVELGILLALTTAILTMVSG